MPLPLPSRFLLVYYLCTECVYWIQLAPDRNECRGYEHFNESSSSTQGGQFLAQLYKYQLHKTDGSCMESVPVNEPRPLPSTSASCRSVHRTCQSTDCSKKYNTSQPISKPPKHRSVLLQTIRSSPQHRVLFWGPHSPLPNVYRGFDPNTKRGKGMKFTAYLHVAPRIKFQGDIPPLPPHVVMAWCLMERRDFTLWLAGS